MTGRTGLEYYRKREDQARKFAREADDPSSRKAHLQMAERYQEIVETGEIPTSRAFHTSALDRR